MAKVKVITCDRCGKTLDGPSPFAISVLGGGRGRPRRLDLCEPCFGSLGLVVPEPPKAKAKEPAPAA